ncbi:winged helix-turn-helix domain-containing protein [Pseudomonas sp. JH-2]|uniref:winged helix-turn-helix domain-containing protein n=1 Tax=Pseudomonas sp. JH-2 TaxID=3114998 RepID=UPI002E2597E6|nr:winged helix-turn-helix domain-containing protein [Pseudomonas sp. JH-2]
MDMIQITPVADARPLPVRIIRTGLADGCLAHFQPELYQLVLQREGFEEKVELGFSGSRLLERLLRQPGEVVARDELLAHAWSDRVVGQGSLNQQIYTLRQILGDEKRREIIQTLPRRGYMLNPRFAVCAPVEAEETATSGQVPATPPMPASPHRRWCRPELLAVAAPVLLAGVALAATLHYGLQRTQGLRADLDIGNKHFTYLDARPQGLAQLRERTGALSARLAALSERPAHFTLSRHAGFYELACSTEDASTRLLLIHQDQLARLADDQLRSCLP